MKKDLFTKLWLRVGMIVAIMTTALSGTVWAEDVVVTLDNIGAGLASTANTTAATTSITATGTTDSYTLNYYQCKKQGNAMLMTKSVSPYISNKTAMPGNIKSVEVFINSGAAAKTTYDCAFSNTECNSAVAGIGAVNITGGNSHTFTNSSAQGKYFCITLGNANNGQVLKLVVTCEKEGGTPAPSISADNVNIAYNATSGSIVYTINNVPSPAGTLTASTTSDWLSVGTVGATVPFTCTANNSLAARTATVTLTYTYGSNQTATKNVTVTQAADPNAVNNISDITAAGTYTVKGTIVAKSQRGFIVGDGTGYVYYYNTGYAQADYNIGDIVKLDGSVVVYGGVFEFNSSTTITSATESNYVAEGPTVLTGSQMDTRVASTTPAQLSTYVQYEGVLSVSGTYYNITSIDGASTAKGSISYPISTDFTSLNGKTVKVTGYYVGISSSQYYNTMIGSIEEVVNADPVISASDVNIDYDATSGEIAYTIANPTSATLTAALTTGDWISNVTVDAVNNKVTFTATANEGNADRTATITLSYTGATDKIVTVTQGHFVADYATLPFIYDGNGAMLGDEAGVTTNDLSTYASSPAIKFDDDGDYFIIKINEVPGVLTFDIKAYPGNNGVWAGTFKIQASIDGTDYSDVASYSEFTTEVESKTVNNLPTSARYIKFIYNKTTGNVALGNIYLAQYGVVPTYTLSWSAGANTDLFVFDAADESTPLTSGVAIAVGTTIKVSIDVAEGYTLSTLTVKDASDNNVAVTEVGENYYSFVMPSSNVTIASTAVEASAFTGDKYVKVVSADDLTDGQYLIVYEEGSVAFDGGLETLDAVGNTINVTISNNEIAADATTNAASFTIDVAAGTILSASGLYIGQTSDANGLKASDEEEYENSITLSDGNADIVSSGGAYLRYNSASNQLRFRYYKSSSYTGQKAIQLYKKVEAPITVTVGEALYTTYVAPVAVSFPDDVTAYIVTSKTETAVTLTEKASVPAGTPVVVKATEAGTYALTTTTTPESVDGNLLLASDGNVQGGEGIYALSTLNGTAPVGFYPVSSDIKVPAGKAYLYISGGNVKGYTFDFDDDATGISNLKDSKDLKDSKVIYNLAGQRLQKMQKGINIVNGKKVLY